ncbi:MAG: protein-disulfide reductase DsbD family protein [Flavobacteriia bacterium]|jgi:thiol:disulfide interchange protein|nr:thioredoxin family protein [Cryomorphaceae bacterium]
MTIFRSLLSVLFVLLTVNAISQTIDLPEDKVKWSFSVEQDGDDAFIVAKIKVVEHWHINASKLPKGSFGFPTSLELKKGPQFSIEGGVIEPKPIQVHDEVADEDLAYHEGSFQLKRKIKILSEKDFEISGTFAFQTCDEFKCLPDMSVPFKVNVKGAIASNDAKADTTAGSGSKTTVDSNDADKEADKKSDGKEKKSERRSLWATFIISFLSGLLALFTPCVFPMVPMTVSFFTKQSKTKAKGIRNSLIFGISIILIYIVLGTAVTAIFGEEALNNMSTDPVFNLIFFIILIIFAISFLGAFEIRLPSKWVNKADQNADRGGLIGIFFMALALALVSFSCTGPIVGTLIVEAARQGGITPIIGMFGFSLALAIPFGLFAAFPAWLNTLPKSGGWLNSVKVVLGFLELALAFKFLSNADMTWDAHLLERELFLAVWIAIFGVLTLYLFGKIKMPHDSPVENLSVGRVLLGTTTLFFVIYMIPGMWGAPLQIISAFPPPMEYSESPLGVGGGGGAATGDIGPEGTVRGPQNLWVFHDYDKALAYAKEVNKPLFVDFTGINCVNCRRMEQKVWGEDGIIESLKNDVVIVSLHVDERKALPKKEQGEFKVAGRKMTVKFTGDKWKLMQIKRYKILAQPYYVMQDPNGKDLSNGSADFEHTSDPKDFKKWLDAGISEFSKNK